jgi:hypothetical protein
MVLAHTDPAAVQAWGGTYENEMYDGALHGWMIPGGKVYNPDRAERGFAKLMAMLDITLRFQVEILEAKAWINHQGGKSRTRTFDTAARLGLPDDRGPIQERCRGLIDRGGLRRRMIPGGTHRSN